jgi:hypothetical protein
MATTPAASSVATATESHAGGDPREDLVRRVAASTTFEKSFRLRTFFLYVSRCGVEGRPEAATEQQIGIHVFGRPPGYNPNEDNIVRSQARLLRLKLEHHFAHEGKDEAYTISIPKGQYLPVFEKRIVPEAPEPVAPAVPAVAERSNRFSRPSRLAMVCVALGVGLGVQTFWIARLLASSSTRVDAASKATPNSPGSKGSAGRGSDGAGMIPVGAVTPGEIRILAGRTGEPYVDIWGRRWEADRDFEGGQARPGVQNLYPPAPDPGLFKTMREALTGGANSPAVEPVIRYRIPVAPGIYEMRLYFADPGRPGDIERGGDNQNTRHFAVSVNGKQVLRDFDPTADAVPGVADVRAFKDISPAADGAIHLQFSQGYERPFINAIEITPGTAGKLKPIRISARPGDFVDAEGNRWSGDNYFIGGRSVVYDEPEFGLRLPPLYSTGRYGNFTYAVPVPPGSYTVRLHFAESFFTPDARAGVCHGDGCRVFDVACNGVQLLHDLDVQKAAGGAFRAIVRSFHGLRPNGQGKIQLSFTSTANYAEIRAIEVLDEAR